MRRLAIGLALLLGLAGHPATGAPPIPEFSYTETKVQVVSIRIRDDVSFDEAVESLKLRANQHNLKFVGNNALYKEIEALTGKTSRRMEIFSFCDGLAAQQMIAANPLLIAFMPCRIALLEDAQGARWVVSMMIGDALIAALPVDIRNNAQRIMSTMKDMMFAASNGDL